MTQATVLISITKRGIAVETAGARDTDRASDHRSMSQYDTSRFSFDEVCPRCEREFSSFNGVTKHYGFKHPTENAVVDVVGEERLKRLYESTSENQLAKQLGISRHYLKSALENIGSRRGPSEAERLKWEQMSEEERSEQVSAAHEKTRERVANGDHPFQQIWDENPELAQQRVERAAALGAAGRETNGMRGLTGQAHHLWNGGKGLRDALIKQFHGHSWSYLREQVRKRQDRTCQMCGEERTITDRGLDVHHIVPVLCGGSNDRRNLMALCTSCHHKTESYTRNQIPEIKPLFSAFQ